MHDRVGVVEHPLDPVLGHDDGDREVVDQARDRREHLLGAGRVESGRRLVEEDDPRVGGEHRPDGDPLLLAAGQLAQGGVAQLGDAEQVERLLDALAHGGRRQAELLHAVGELLLDRVRDEPGERVLPDDPHEVGEVARSVVAGVPPVDAHVPGERPPGEVRHPGAHRPEERRLARAGAAHDERELTLLDREIDGAQRRAVGPGQGHRDPLERDGVVSHGSPPPPAPRASASGAPVVGVRE